MAFAACALNTLGHSATWEQMHGEAEKQIANQLWGEAEVTLQSAIRLLEENPPYNNDEKIAKAMWMVMLFVECLWRKQAYDQMYAEIVKYFKFFQTNLNKNRSNGLIIGNIFFHLRFGQVCSLF